MEKTRGTAPMTKNKQRLARTFLLPAVIVLILGIFTAGLFLYQNSLKVNLNTANHETLSQIMEQQRFTFSSKLFDQQNTIKTYADSLSNADAMETGELLGKLKTIAENSTYDFVSYVWPNGDTLENTGTRLNVADREYFNAALEGATVIANPMKSRVTGEYIVTFATPVWKQGEITGVLVGIYDAHNLTKLLKPSFNGKGYTYITTSSGEVVAKTETNSTLSLYSNLFDGLDTAVFQGEESSQTIRLKVAAGESGHAQYQHDGEDRMLYYAPLGIMNWYIFSVAPNEAIVPQSISIAATTTVFMLFIAVIAILVSVVFLLAQRKYLKNLKKLAFVDTLTGVANHKAFQLAAAEVLSGTREQYAFVIMDVDKFKVLNDTFGYAVGDEFLICIAEILKQNVSKTECFGRRDSDEYDLLLTYTSEQDLTARIQALFRQIEGQFSEKVSDTYNLVLCAGIYVIHTPGAQISSISDKARHAQRLIKGAEESGICFYKEDIRNKILEEKNIENKMHSALKNENFLLYLQPKYALNNEEICGAEALSRWEDGGGIIFPDAYIPVFERTGFITKLDMYMLEKTCQTIRGWIDSGITPVPVSINFSRVDLKKSGFVDDMAAVVARYRVPPQLIELELTESTMLHNEAVVLAMLEHLHEHGFSLSMDDFGSGYSSLGLLKNLPIDIIKLDRTFFVDYSELKRGATVVEGILSIAKKLGIHTVAEGVETKEQVLFLKEMGCDMVQGYYYARPMPADSLTAILGGEPGAR